MNTRPIVFCTTGVLHTTGGIASVNRNILKSLESIVAEQGRDLVVLTLCESVPSTAKYRTFYGNKLAFTLAVLNASLRAELVIFDHVQIAKPILFLPRLFRPKVVICAHGSEAGKRIRHSSKWLFHIADLVLINSSYTLACMRRYIDRFNGQVCTLGLPPQHVMTSEPPLPDEEEIVMTSADGRNHTLGSRVMLLVGRIDAGEREKGHRELLEVMPVLVDKFPDTQLVFVGSGTDEVELREIATLSSVASQIFICGEINDDQLDKLYRKCYAYVMPSRQEGFGLAYLEAMNYAKPCIACRNDGGAEVVVDGETGYLVNQPIDLENLAQTLESLLGDEVAANKMGRAGWYRLQNNFSSTAHQQRVATHICNLLAQPSNQKAYQ